MSDELALLRAIAESPDDLHLRLVFADWCEEHGHDARAALIRGQCLLDPLLRVVHNPAYDSPPTDVRSLSCLSLEPGVYRQVLGPLAELMQEPPSGCQLRRGFIEQITLAGLDTVRKFLALTPPVLHCHPVSSLRIYRSPNDLVMEDRTSFPTRLMRELVTLPGIERVQNLDLCGYILGIGPAEILMSSALTPARLRLRYRELSVEFRVRLEHRFGRGLALINDVEDIPF